MKISAQERSRMGPILYEDSAVVVVCKPAGVVVNRAESVREETVQDWMEQRYPENFQQDYPGSDPLFLARSGMVHRLDKETSGVLLLAKNGSSMRILMSQFKNRETDKEYLALVHQNLKVAEGVISLPLGRSSYNRRRFGVVLGGKMSQTGYRVEDRFADPGNTHEHLTLVALYPKTGRTHQLRVVLKHIGHPIVADDVYLGKRRLKADLKWCPRLFLHARRLEFAHPETGERLSISAPLAADLTLAAAQLKKVE